MVKEAFGRVFDEIVDVIKSNLGNYERGIFAEGVALSGASGTQDFEFALDEAGRAKYEFSKYGAGVTVNCQAWIIDPDDIYDLVISSSDGGGGTWSGLRANQKIAFSLTTSLWKNTNFIVSVKARSKRSVGGKGTLNYSY